MKVIKYELTVVSEEMELPIEEDFGGIDTVNEEMCSYSLVKIKEEDFEFEARSEEGEETGSWYEKWYTKAGELLGKEESSS